VKRISTVIIGAGQAGLAISRLLSERAVPHVLLERGQIANSWRTERWDSLRLLTPNWQSRLPGHSYTGSDPDGFMDMPGVVAFLERYAASGAAPVETGTTVTSVTKTGNAYHVLTDRGDWSCSSLVLASGACNKATIPACAAELPEHITQLTPLDYRNPSQLGAGRVLVVGASATGVQLAAEIRSAGHPVTLAAGNHIRMPRYYRGRDIQWWLDRTGLLSTTVGEVDDIRRARAVPSLQLVGSSRARFLDLNALQDRGVELVGRFSACRDGSALFSGSLANAAALSDQKMNRALSEIDQWAETAGIETPEPPARFAPTRIPANPRLKIGLAGEGFGTVIWATGFEPDFGWLHLPVFDGKGRLKHREGIVAPGLYALGLPFLRTRKSSLIDGVGDDARMIADHICLCRAQSAA
jgi:putative flavoprotein involved in K+ transport